jgi:hypothetical protein
VLATASDAALRREPTQINRREPRRVLKRGSVTAFKAGRLGTRQRASSADFSRATGRLAEPILRSLPRLLKVRLRERGTAAVGAKLDRVLGRGVRRRATRSAMVLARLSEVLFAEAIRQYMDELPSGTSGWLAALRDRYVGRTLSLLHAQPAYPWTVEALARKGRAVALGAGRAIHRAHRVTADAIPDPMANLARGGAICARATRRSFGWRRTSAMNPKPRSIGVQAGVRTASRAVAQAADAR